MSRDPFELYASEDLLLEEDLTAADLTAISSLPLSADWQDL